MKKYLLYLLVAALFCSVTSGGCGGGSEGGVSGDDTGYVETFGEEESNGNTDDNTGE